MVGAYVGWEFLWGRFAVLPSGCWLASQGEIMERETPLWTPFYASWESSVLYVSRKCEVINAINMITCCELSMCNT